jgi:hypothetical protein
MATYTKYNSFVEAIAAKLVDAFGTGGTADTFKVAIHTDTPVNTFGADDTSVANLTQIAGSNGYTTDGENITFGATRPTPGTQVVATASDVIWTATGGNLGASTTGRYFSIHSSTASRLMCSFDFGTTFTVASGETMTLDFGASLWTLE